jgi:glycosyltransferase involved in cell wall biosynthesis
MNSNTQLSIVIPTYNRADFLDYCLEVHIPLARAHNVQIFISDNASTDATKKVVEKWQVEYPLIRYHRNETNVGPDENFERALKYPKTEYVWLLGDAYQIPPEGIDSLFKIISKENQRYDAIVFNVENRVSDIAEQDYSNKNWLLSDLGWHMTCMSSLIYNTKIIANANFERYRKTNFIQTGVIFEYIENKEFLVHWKKSISVQPIVIEHIKKVSWQDRTFEIWTKNWINFIFSLPSSYELDTKLKCVTDHGIKSGLFSLKGLLNLRSNNCLNIKQYKKYSVYFPLTIKYSKFTILIIALLPISILRILKATIKSVYRLK